MDTVGAAGPNDRKQLVLDTTLRKYAFMGLRQNLHSADKTILTVTRLLVSGARSECFLVRQAYMLRHEMSDARMNTSDVTSLSRVLVERRSDDPASFAEALWAECVDLSSYLLSVRETHGEWWQTYIPPVPHAECAPAKIFANVAWFLAGVNDAAYISPLFSAVMAVTHRMANDVLLTDVDQVKSLVSRAVTHLCVDQLVALKEACPASVFSDARNQHFGDAKSLGFVFVRLGHYDRDETDDTVVRVRRAYAVRHAACRMMTCLMDGVNGEKDVALLEWIVEMSALFQSRNIMEHALREMKKAPSQNVLRRALVYVAMGSITFDKPGFCVPSVISSLRRAGAPWHEQDVLLEMMRLFGRMTPWNARFHGVYRYMLLNSADSSLVLHEVHDDLVKALSSGMIRPSSRRGRGRLTYLVHSLLPLMHADIVAGYSGEQKKTLDSLRTIRGKHVRELQKKIEKELQPPFEGGKTFLRLRARYESRRT